MQDNERLLKIVETLKANDAHSIKFATTKEQLLKAGYSEEEITRALYEHPYDGKPNVKKPEDPATKLYEQHPELADKVANEMVETDMGNRRTQATIDAAAAITVTPNRQGHYMARLSDSLGLPFLTLFVIGLLLEAAVITIGLPTIIFEAFVVVVLGIFAVRFIQTFLIKK